MSFSDLTFFNRGLALLFFILPKISFGVRSNQTEKHNFLIMPERNTQITMIDRPDIYLVSSILLAISAKFKFIDFLLILGGVPVFNLFEEKPKSIKFSVNPLEEASPSLPALKDLFPICIKPFKKVPQVTTTATQFNNMPFLVIAPTTLLLFSLIWTTSSSKTKTLTSLLIIFCIIGGYFFYLPAPL